MDRRLFLRGALMSGFAAAVTGCGGGGSGGTGNAPATVGTTPTPPPAPTPAPTPPPAPTPTLNGVTIEQAERDIRALIEPEGEWILRARALHSDVTVTSPAEFQAAVAALFDTSVNPGVAAQNHRIQLAWNGPASLPGAVNARVNVGRVYGTASHLESGGSITIAAAAGFRPAFANTVYINGQGIIVQGVGFTRSTASGELPSATAGVLLTNGASQPLEPVVHFQNCYFGNAAGLGSMRDFASAGVPFPDNAVLANGIVTQGLSRSLSFTGCRFWGTLNAAKLVTRRLRIEDSDFAAMAMDAIDIFGHTFTSGYTAAAWITRCTFRDCIDTWENRNQHVDGIQYCAPMDIHQGTRLLVTDCSMHLAHSFAGDPGMGGGSQGMHGGNNPTLDNQFVVRRTTIMSTAPNTFTYYSPRASRPSFVDQCTFFRAGRTPSAFAPDRQPQQDYLVGITGSASYFPASGDWLLVTNTIASDLYAGEGAITETIPVDPRPTAAPQLRPESVFNGRDFARGSASVNGLPQKFGYDLPNERRSQAAFVADMWANFSPASAHAGRGAPDPRSIAWRA